MNMTAQTLFALATATALGQLMSYYNVAILVKEFFIANSFSSAVFFMNIIVLFLIIGTFMDAIPAMTLLVPILLPVAISLGISPVIFGLVTVITLAIGLITPPYGLCLLIAGTIGELSVEKSFKAVGPYLITILVIDLLVAFFPQIFLFIPTLIKPDWFMAL